MAVSQVAYYFAFSETCSHNYVFASILYYFQKLCPACTNGSIGPCSIASELGPFVYALPNGRWPLATALRLARITRHWSRKNRETVSELEIRMAASLSTVSCTPPPWVSARSVQTSRCPSASLSFFSRSRPRSNFSMNVISNSTARSGLLHCSFLSSSLSVPSSFSGSWTHLELCFNCCYFYDILLWASSVVVICV